jgi:hypothetical protein
MIFNYHTLINEIDRIQFKLNNIKLDIELIKKKLYEDDDK